MIYAQSVITGTSITCVIGSTASVPLVHRDAWWNLAEKVKNKQLEASSLELELSEGLVIHLLLFFNLKNIEI